MDLILSRVLKFLVLACLLILFAVTTAWVALAFWFRLPLPDLGRMLAADGFVLFGCGVLILMFGRHRPRALAAFGVALIGVAIWWNTIRPTATADWSPEVSRQVTGTIEGDMLTLTNMRNFQWLSPTDMVESWETRSYDLTKLQSLDLLMSYWAGPEIAHVMLSFGFEDDTYLAWSVEVRRRGDGVFSPIGDFFKSNTLVIVAATERDVVGVRTNVRGEDVQLYRMNTAPAQARLLLEEYVIDANALAAKPEFFNSLTSNCTTTIIRLMRAAGANVPFDWRMIVNGYLPDFAYERGALDTRETLEQLRALSHIDVKAQSAGLNGTYSKAVRQGIPSPLN